MPAFPVMITWYIPINHHHLQWILYRTKGCVLSAAFPDMTWHNDYDNNLPSCILFNTSPTSWCPCIKSRNLKWSLAVQAWTYGTKDEISGTALDVAWYTFLWMTCGKGLCWTLLLWTSPFQICSNDTLRSWMDWQAYRLWNQAFFALLLRLPDGMSMAKISCYAFCICSHCRLTAGSLVVKISG